MVEAPLATGKACSAVPVEWAGGLCGGGASERLPDERSRREPKDSEGNDEKAARGRLIEYTLMVFVLSWRRGVTVVGTQPAVVNRAESIATRPRRPRQGAKPAFIAVVAAVALSQLGCGGGGRPASAGTQSSGTAAVARPARFDSLPQGWAQTNGGAAHLDRTGATTWTLATSWPYVSDPVGPAHDVPPGELFIAVVLIRRATNGDRRSNLCERPPISPDVAALGPGDLSLANASHGHLEGRPDLPEYRLFGSVRDDYWLDLRVAVNSRRPTDELLRRAETAISALVLPDWPNRCN